MSDERKPDEAPKPSGKTMEQALDSMTNQGGTREKMAEILRDMLLPKKDEKK